MQTARALVRAEARRPLEAALEWGLPRCRTPEERLLYPALLLLLGNLNALVAHRRLEPGDSVGFQLTLSRAHDDAPPTRRHLVVRAATSIPGDAPATGSYWLPKSEIHASPFAAAALVLERLLNHRVADGPAGHLNG